MQHNKSVLSQIVWWSGVVLIVWITIFELADWILYGLSGVETLWLVPFCIAVVWFVVGSVQGWEAVRALTIFLLSVLILVFGGLYEFFFTDNQFTNIWSLPAALWIMPFYLKERRRKKQ